MRPNLKALAQISPYSVTTACPVSAGSRWQCLLCQDLPKFLSICSQEFSLLMSPWIIWGPGLIVSLYYFETLFMCYYFFKNNVAYSSVFLPSLSGCYRALRPKVETNGNAGVVYNLAPPKIFVSPYSWFQSHNSLLDATLEHVCEHYAICINMHIQVLGWLTLVS